MAIEPAVPTHLAAALAERLAGEAIAPDHRVYETARRVWNGIIDKAAGRDRAVEPGGPVDRVYDNCPGRALLRPRDMSAISLVSRQNSVPTGAGFHGRQQQPTAAGVP